ncbi:hypothetical protein IG631_19165 [Alternaria alternata]|nr:hypothetical protein IG631_19165 [Alternaria alternata]
MPTVFHCVARRKEASRVSLPSCMLPGFDGARNEESTACVSLPSSTCSTLAVISCSCTSRPRCGCSNECTGDCTAESSWNGMFWPCEEPELDLDIVRKLIWSKIDAIVSSLQHGVVPSLGAKGT